MKGQQCRCCKHYLQHYVITAGRLMAVYCGHCTLRSAKRKKPDVPACSEFLLGNNPTEMFATKEYLTKELLQHILKMELLPEITMSDKQIK